MEAKERGNERVEHRRALRAASMVWLSWSLFTDSPGRLGQSRGAKASPTNTAKLSFTIIMIIGMSRGQQYDRSNSSIVVFNPPSIYKPEVRKDKKEGCRPSPCSDALGSSPSCHERHAWSPQLLPSLVLSASALSSASLQQSAQLAQAGTASCGWCTQGPAWRTVPQSPVLLGSPKLARFHRDLALLVLSA